MQWVVATAAFFASAVEFVEAFTIVLVVGVRESTGSRYCAKRGGYSVKIIKAIYNFVVGDMVILIGIALTVSILALINNVSILAPLKGFSGTFLVLGVLSSLIITLSREAFSARR